MRAVAPGSLREVFVGRCDAAGEIYARYVSSMREKQTLSRREEYAEATRTALLDAAREIFLEEGFQEAGVEAIARRARVTARMARAEDDPFARLRAGARHSCKSVWSPLIAGW